MTLPHTPLPSTAAPGTGAPGAGSAGVARSRAAAPGRRTVDAPTRMTHWLMAISFSGAYLTAGSELWRALHVTLGYTLALLLAWRLAYGLLGPRPARLGTLWRRIAGLPRWGRERLSIWRQGRGLAGAAQQGPHLAMGLALLAMLALITPVVLSGYGAYQEWGASWGDGEWLGELHEFFGNALLLAVLVHLALIALLSWQRGQNHALPMLTGRQRGPGPDLVPRNRAALAVLLLAGVLGFWAWQWQEYPHGLLPDAAAVATRDGHDDDD